MTRHDLATHGRAAPLKANVAVQVGRSAVWIAVLTAVAPTLTVNVCYLVSSTQSLVPACVPYLEGCTSISSAGRYGISYYLFKAGMVCSAALLVAYWRRMSGHILAESGRAAPMVAATGTGGAVFLVLYTAFLGTEGDIYFLLRRFGTILYSGSRSPRSSWRCAAWKPSRRAGSRGRRNAAASPCWRSAAPAFR